MNPAEVEQLPDEVEITPSQVTWLLDHFFRYQAQARSYLDAGMTVSRKEGKRRVSPELLARVRAQYEELGGQRGAITQLARIHDVRRETIWRWLKRAGSA